MRLWEIRGAASPGIPRCRRVLPGCANTQDLSSPRSARALSRGRACFSCSDRLPRVSNSRFVDPCSVHLANGGRASPPGWTGETPVPPSTCLLSVACRTARNITHCTQIVFVCQIHTQRNLIHIALSIHSHRLPARRLLIAHVEYLVARPQIFLRRTVAIEAPLHLQRCVVIHQRHAIHRTMAGVAAYSFINMNAVIEVDEIRK